MSAPTPTRPRVGGGRPGSPPDREERPGGGGRGWVELFRAAGDIEAHLLTGRLWESGIQSQTVTDRSVPGAFLYGGHNPWAPVAVLVRKLQLEDARIVLAELALGRPAATPEDRRPPPRRGPAGAVLWWFVALLLAVAFTVLGMAHTIDRCERLNRCDAVFTGNGR